MTFDIWYLWPCYDKDNIDLVPVSPQLVPSYLVQTAETDREVIGSQHQSTVRDEELERRDVSGGGEDPATVGPPLHPPGEAVLLSLGVAVQSQVPLTDCQAAQGTPARCVCPADYTGHPPHLTPTLSLSTGETWIVCHCLSSGWQHASTTQISLIHILSNKEIINFW